MCYWSAKLLVGNTQIALFHHNWELFTILPTKPVCLIILRVAKLQKPRNLVTSSRCLNTLLVPQVLNKCSITSGFYIPVDQMTPKQYWTFVGPGSHWPQKLNNNVSKLTLFDAWWLRGLEENGRDWRIDPEIQSHPSSPIHPLVTPPCYIATSVFDVFFLSASRFPSKIGPAYGTRDVFLFIHCAVCENQLCSDFTSVQGEWAQLGDSGEEA